jgi:hypothetical protein
MFPFPMERITVPLVDDVIFSNEQVAKMIKKLPVVCVRRVDVPLNDRYKKVVKVLRNVPPIKSHAMQ